MDLSLLVLSTKSIAWKELNAIIISAHSCGTQWQHRKIIIACDNLTVVDVWETGTSESPELIALVFILLYLATYNNYNIYN